MHACTVTINALAALAALAAACLWFRSATARVLADNKPSPDGIESASIVVQEQGKPDIDFLATAEAQTRWNKWAALAASIAALLQCLGLVLGGV